jgi:carbamoyltransferase
VICSPDHIDSSNYCWRQFLEKKLKCEVIDLSSQHHLQHAALAFYNSGFEKSLVLVIDRNGTRYCDYREAETIFTAEYPCKFEPIIKNFWRDSDYVIDQDRLDIINGLSPCEVNLSSRYGIVKVYETATSLIQQHALENGKTMGLAAYGKKQNFEKLFCDEFIPNDRLFSHSPIKDENAAINKFLQQSSTEQITPDNFQQYADYAFHVQESTQDAVKSLIRKAVAKTGIKNICVTGGYALNVVANASYLTEFPDCKFYFEPLADDSGNSLGGAMLMYRNQSRDSRVVPLNNTFFNSVCHDLSTISGDSCSPTQVVTYLIEQNSIGIFQEKSEAGPRALGNRSILFDARNSNAKTIINKIKKREWYRPFAAMVLADQVNDYFQIMDNADNRFMVCSYQVHESKKNIIPGVVHADNSCRIQTVCPEDGVIYEILKEFYRQTGVPILLNTSLNLAGAPLIDTPDQAVTMLRESSLDMLYFPKIRKIIK